MKLTRLISAILVVIMMMSIFASCDLFGTESPSGVESSKDQATASDSLTLVSGNASQYTIVTPDSGSAAAKAAALAIKTEIQKLSECELSLVTDAAEAVEYEILIGQTNRDESIIALEGLKYNDYTVVISGKKLVINAQTEEKLAEAADYVIELIKGKTGGEVVFTAEDQKTYKAEYAQETVYVGDIDLNGYYIVVPKENGDREMVAAEKIQAKIIEVSGIYLPIITDDKKTEKEILIGETSREESKAVDASSLGESGFSVSVAGSKIVVKTSDREFSLNKLTTTWIEAIEKDGKIKVESGSFVSELVLTSFMFTDVHNNFEMLEPTNNKGKQIVRKNVESAIKYLSETVGKVDLVMVGGDLMSDYPSWNSSGNLPYEYFVSYRALLVKTFKKLAKDGKSVIYIAGNHDYAQGEKSTDGPGKNGSYNSCDFYFGDAGMRQDMGELPEENMFYEIGNKTGEKYLLAYYYEVNGVAVFGISPDHDIIWSEQGSGMNKDCIAWLDQKLDEIDPTGDRVILINCHYFIDMRTEIDANGYNNYSNTKDKKDMEYALLGHKNLYLIYGHGEMWYSDGTARYITHHNAKGTAQDIIGVETESTQVISYARRDYTTVYGGTFRPGPSYNMWFKNDYLIGDGGYGKGNHSHHTTGTPRVAQGMYIEVFEDRIVFTMMNFGDLKPYRTGEDLIEPYTVWLYK